MPIVSITTPSYGRQKILERQHRIVAAQSEQDFEWLILDDSPQASPYFLGLTDPRIRYHHHAGPRLSIGAKRNWLADRAARHGLKVVSMGMSGDFETAIAHGATHVRVGTAIFGSRT